MMRQFYLYFLLFFIEIVKHVDGGELFALLGPAVSRFGGMVDQQQVLLDMLHCLLGPFLWKIYLLMLLLGHLPAFSLLEGKGFS